MNPETRKQTVLKIVIVSGIACIGWMLLIKPAMQNVNDQHQTVKAHKELIVEYKQRVGALDSQESLVVQEQLQGMLDSLAGLTVQGDSGTVLHSLINEVAGKNGVSITRIESVNASQLVEKIEGTPLSVEGIHNVARVEIEGDYGSVISFMNDVVSGPVQVSFTSFRFIATGDESVRVHAEMNSIMLTSIPSDSDLGGANDE